MQGYMEEVVKITSPSKKEKKSIVRRKHKKWFGIEKGRIKSISTCVFNPFRTIFSFPSVKEYDI